jgi:hypothetical protein
MPWSRWHLHLRATVVGTLPALFTIKKQAAIKSLCLSSVWRVFVGYQLVRSALFFTRVHILADKDSSSSAETRE